MIKVLIALSCVNVAAHSCTAGEVRFTEKGGKVIQDMDYLSQ